MRGWLLRCVIVILFLIQIGCGEVSSGDNAGQEGGPCYKNGTCDPGLICLSKTCVRLPDSGALDMHQDAPLPDLSVVDQRALDWPVSDLGALEAQVSDLENPDLHMPDLAWPEAAVPDQKIPDLSIPDQAVQDQLTPDLAMPDVSMPDHLVPDT